MREKSGKKGRWLSLLLALMLMLSGTVLHIAINTDFGKVKVNRVSYSDGLGNMVSGLLYVPHTATVDTPAPAIMTNHGGGASLEAQSSYNVELSRRGYVVLSWDASNSGSSEASLDATHGGEATYRFLQGLDYVQKDALATSGHSMGGVYSFMVAQNHSDNVKLEIAVGMNPGMNDTDSPFFTNYACIIGLHDESNLVRSDGDIINTVRNELYHKFFGMAENETVEPNQLYGSWEDGTARVFYTPNATHGGAMISREVQRIYLETVNNVLSAPNYIVPTDQVWFYKDVGMALQFAGLIIIMFTLAVFALNAKCFAGLLLPERKPVGFKRKTIPWFISMVVLLFLPTALFIPATTLAQKFKLPAVFGLDSTANGFALWSLISAVALLIFFLIYHFVYGKRAGGNLITYGLATEKDQARIGGGYLLKSFVLAGLVIGGTFLVYLVMYGLTGGDIHIWLASLRPVTFVRLHLYPLYFLLQLPFFLIGSLAGRSISLNNGERTAGKGMRSSLIISLLIGVLGLACLFTVYWITFKTTGTVLFKNDRGYIYAGAIFSMLPAFAVGNTINCYITNKTNSIYAGVFSAMLWSAWLMVAANALA